MSTDESKSGWPTWLTVVIIIMAVLLVIFCVVAIACAGMFWVVRAPMQQQAETAMTKAQIFQIEAALGHYQVMIGEYPTTEQGLSALQQCPADLANPNVWDGPYLEELPVDAWDNPYQYELQDGSPTIWSFGPDGIDGTDDDIGDW